MSTFEQRVRLVRLKKKIFKKTPALKNNPQMKAQVVQIVVKTPKKPNSARRLTARAAMQRKNIIIARIPGSGFLIKKYSIILVRGGGSRDLPGNNYSASRGVYDLEGIIKKTKRRSIYGVKKPPETKKWPLRRIYRKAITGSI